MLHLILLVTLWYHPLGDQSAADQILHIWQTRTKDGKIQMFKMGNTYCAKMLYGKDLFESDGKTYKKDVNNPNPALRSRSLNNYILITGLVYKEGKWTDGKIYYYKDGNFYDVTIEIKDNVMNMRVYKGFTLFGKTLEWDMLE